MNSRAMPCQSCIATEKFPAAASSSCAAIGKGMARLRKGFPLRPRFRKSQISAMESSSYWDREESRWLREEERWKREEQRWLREETRWYADREIWAMEKLRMKEEIACLQKEVDRLQGMEKQDSFSSPSLKELLVGLLRTLSDKNDQQASDRSAKSPAMVTEKSVESIKFVLSQSSKAEDGNTTAASSRKGDTKSPNSSSSASSSKDGSKELSETKMDDKAAPSTTGKQERRSLQYGSEGDDVKLLQEALAKLGFHSGDDDMEYASFSRGTDSAVKSWQASIGALEDGIVTGQALSQLISEHQVVVLNSPAVIKTTLAKPSPAPEIVESSSFGRVYLLGENRWEDPERLLHRRREKPTGNKCFTCKGEGRTLCSECDGTGELNVEEQFLEWAGEGAKCPYCEGSGTVICDDCEGRGVPVA